MKDENEIYCSECSKFIATNQWNKTETPELLECPYCFALQLINND